MIDDGTATEPLQASAVMNERQSAPTGLKFACETVDPVDSALLADLQQTARLSNENCDRAAALAYMLSAELREAQERISQLEEANGRLEQTKHAAEDRVAHQIAEPESRVAQSELLRAETAARIEETNEKAEEGAREKAEAESRVARLQDQLAQADTS